MSKLKKHSGIKKNVSLGRKTHLGQRLLEGNKVALWRIKGKENFKECLVGGRKQ